MNLRRNLGRTLAACAASVLVAGIPLALTVQAQEPPELERLESADGRSDRAQSRGFPGSLAGLNVARPAAFFLASLDDDGDFSVDEGELSAGLAAAYAALDADADARVSILDYSDWAERALAARYSEPSGPGIDADLDGSVTELEFVAAFEGLARAYGMSAAEPLTFSMLQRPIRPRGDEARGDEARGDRPAPGSQRGDGRNADSRGPGG